MSRQLACSQAIHDHIRADHAAFRKLPSGGYQIVEALGGEPGDVLELRTCACGSTLSLALGVGERLEAARVAKGGVGDQSMIARCQCALRGDVEAIRAYVSAVEMERLMGGVR